MLSAPVSLAQRLVRIPSHPGVERQEEAVAQELAGFFAEHAIEAAFDEAAPGRPNVLASVAGPRPGRHLLLCGHTDTVPLNASDPGFGFSGDIRDGLLVGRGAVDMKGPLAAMAAALVTLSRPGALPAGRLTLAAVVDEEMQSLGCERLVLSGFSADGAVVGEPTGNRIALGHRGLEWLEIEFLGRAAHGGRPEAGINAIAAAARFLRKAEDRLIPTFAARAHPLLGPPTWNVGTIAGGDQPSTVAASCRVTLDRRTVPGESFASVTGEIEALLAEVRDETPGLATRLERLAGAMATMEHVGFATPSDYPLVAAALSAAIDVFGSAGELTAFPAWTDGALLSGHAGMPTIVVGPGDLSLAHSPREAIPVAEVEAAARFYARLAERFCSGEAA